MPGVEFEICSNMEEDLLSVATSMDELPNGSDYLMSAATSSISTELELDLGLQDSFKTYTKTNSKRERGKILYIS